MESRTRHGGGGSKLEHSPATSCQDGGHKNRSLLSSNSNVESPRIVQLHRKKKMHRREIFLIPIRFVLVGL